MLGIPRMDAGEHGSWNALETKGEESGADGKIVIAFFQSFLKVLAACPAGTSNPLLTWASI